MLYKHKLTDVLYNLSALNNLSGKIESEYTPATNCDASEITVTTKWMHNLNEVDCRTDLDEYIKLSKENQAQHDREVAKVFDKIDLQPTVKLEEVINVKYSLECPICGSPVKWNGIALLTSPAQYPHQCTNGKCGYKFNNPNFHEGEIFYATSHEEVEHILSGLKNKNI